MTGRQMTEAQKIIDEQVKLCQEKCNRYRATIKDATEQLKYWELQFEAARTLSTRLMLDSSKKPEEANPCPPT